MDVGAGRGRCLTRAPHRLSRSQLSLEEARRVMVDDPERFKELVHESLRRHVAAINRLVERGMRWWDYGNSLLLQASRAGADIFKPGRSPAERAAAEGVPESAVAPSKDDFRYPSYVQDIMGDIFSLGFGPFRWYVRAGSVCQRPGSPHRTPTLQGVHLQRCRRSAYDR